MFLQASGLPFLRVQSIQIRTFNPMRKRTKRRIRAAVIIFIILPLLSIFACYLIIERAATGKTFYTTKRIPENKVGLVLGTSNRLIEGGSNPYYVNRINAAVALYEAGKIQYILVSGDNATPYYNEPETFKKDLVDAGIPEDRIYLDYAGFRTLDSMVRAREVFGLDSVTVISQKFHNERAIYLAERKGLTAIGFNAQDISGNRALKVQAREILARVKVFIDLLLNTEPRFYGERIVIGTPVENP